MLDDHYGLRVARSPRGGFRSFYPGVFIWDIHRATRATAYAIRNARVSDRVQNFVVQVIRDAGYFPGARGPFVVASGEAIPDTLLMLAGH